MIKMERQAIMKCRAIVKLGPVSETDGYKLGTFYQVTLDPKMVSPGGDYIRLGNAEGDEIVGWQLVSGMTVCEILGEYAEDGTYPEGDDKSELLSMMVVQPILPEAEV